jgi:SAM-dependent methyltransferase
MNNIFNKDYFENGVAKKISCYENYRWIPELTYPMAYAITDKLKLNFSDKVLEYGCAHGYLVKALNDFKINAYGVDISSYAISKASADIKKKLFTITKKNFSKKLKKIAGNENFKYTIAKDVFEHIKPKDLLAVIRILSNFTKYLFVIVPLGDNGKYRIQSYGEDITHLIAENEEWWKNILEKNNRFKLINFGYRVSGIKDKWIGVHKKGNGFFLLKSKFCK